MTGMIGVIVGMTVAVVMMMSAVEKNAHRSGLEKA
jgi:hypothetical protein